MGMEEKKPAEITENSSDQAKNKAESNPWVLLFLYPDFFFLFKLPCFLKTGSDYRCDWATSGT